MLDYFGSRFKAFQMISIPNSAQESGTAVGDENYF
jgi:hypothetical protein